MSEMVPPFEQEAAVVLLDGLYPKSPLGHAALTDPDLLAAYVEADLSGPDAYDDTQPQGEQ